MLDIKFIREHSEIVKKGIASKGASASLVDDILGLDEEHRELLQKVENLRAEKNKIGVENVTQAREIKKELGDLEEKLWNVENCKQEPYLGLNILLLRLPNLPLSDVPVGKDESGNVEVKKWGEIPTFDFPIKSHDVISADLDLIDTQRAGKVSGTRFGYLKNEAVLLEFALLNFGLDFLVKKGFIPVLPPAMIRQDVMKLLGYNNQGFGETYCLNEDQLCLVATAEHTLVPYYMNEVLNENDLPKRLVGFSACFRREAGSYGKDTKGILRVHQFNKLEMVSYVRPEDSEAEYKFLINIEEELMQALKIPYQLTKMCTGDLGDPAAAKFDIDAWFPSENKYRETHSASNCTDYQSRRLNIKFNRKGGKSEFVHILNGTAFSERPILAILENYQQKDGSVLVPEVLQKYTGFDKISPKKE